MFRVAGRMQYDRANAPGAPWQEFYLELDGGAHWAWLASAQGNWYMMSLYEHPLVLPTLAQAAPGVTLRLAGGEVFTITERSARRPISAEGELPFPFEPGVVESYADLSGAVGGAFGTLDYGSTRAAQSNTEAPPPPQVYFGRQIDPRAIAVDGSSTGGAMAAPAAVLTALKCPGCSGDLPLAAPDRTERVVCRYCGTQSDVNQGALYALKKLPLPTTQPMITLGSMGTLRGQQVTVVGFMERGTTDEDDDRYRWREYLLYAAPGPGGPGGFVFLLEEDGRWEHIVPIGTGELGRPDPETRLFRNQTFRLKQSVVADVESVLGEFYWKVEVGETVQATEWEGPQRAKVSEEQNLVEISCALSTPIVPAELRHAFGSGFVRDPRMGVQVPSIGIGHHLFWLALFGLWFAISVASCARAQDKVVFETDVALKSSLTRSFEKSLANVATGLQRGQRLLPDGGVRTSDLRVGTVVAKPPLPTAPAVVEALKPRIARCFPAVVSGSFNVIVNVGPTGLAKTADAKDVQGLSAAAVACGRAVFFGAQFAGAPAGGATLTIPLQFVPETEAPPPAGGTAPAEADSAVFTDPFEVPVDGRNLKLVLAAPTLNNGYIAADLALVHDATGTVWEDTAELAYYSGTEEGESWSEGSRDASLWYSRVPGGKYVLRIDPALDPAAPVAGPLHIKIVSDTPPAGYVLGSLIALLCLYLISTFARRAKLVRDARKPQPPPHHQQGVPA